MNLLISLTSPRIPRHGNLPKDWRAEWSAEHMRYFYVNINTKESSWALPILPPPAEQHAQAPISIAQNVYTHVESGSIPPAQFTAVHFPPAPSIQQRPPHSQFQQQQPQLPGPANLGQQQNHPSPQHTPCLQQTVQSSPTHLVPHVYPSEAPGSKQEQQHSHAPLNTTLSSNYVIPIASSPHPPTYQPQVFSQQPTPNPTNSQLYNNHGLPHQNQHEGYTAPIANFSTQVFPQSQRPVSYHQVHQPQQNVYPGSTQPHPQNDAQPSHRSSVMGGSLTVGSMVGNMSSKFTQLQKGASSSVSGISLKTSKTTAPSATLNKKAPSSSSSDWKKWGTRAAVGVAAVGALTLGVDAMDGNIFDGATGLEAGGGGDFTGSGDMSGVTDAQTAMDANAAQLAMEQQGQENASMLLDPVGTQYEYVNDNSLI